MNNEEARQAAVHNALSRIEPSMTIGLGSGRAVFALTKLLGEHFPGLSVVVASPATHDLAEAAGLKVQSISESTSLDIAFDGADEVDPDFAMVKGGGAALLTEKIVLSTAAHVVIMIEENKLVERLGLTRQLPVEVVRFGWETTRTRVLEMTDRATLRTEAGKPVVTSENHYLLDIDIAEDTDLDVLAAGLKLTLGVVEHGLFIEEANELIIGQSDGSIQVRTRPE